MKIKSKFQTYIFVLCVATPLTFTMAFFNTAINKGFSTEFIIQWFTSWLISFVIAYPVALTVVPFAKKITSKIEWT